MRTGLSVISVMMMLLAATPGSVAQVSVSDSLVVISGYVRELEHKKSLAGSGVSVPGTNIATVTNEDGYFSIKIPAGLEPDGIKVEHLGYLSESVPTVTPAEGSALTVWMKRASKMLGEVTVTGAQPRELIESALEKIPDNYPSTHNLFSSFYRETIRKGRRFIGVSEAVADVYKKPYRMRTTAGERVRIVRGRRLMSPQKNDTIAVKIVGGPTLPIVLDVVKNEDALFSIAELDYYDFRMEPMETVDGRNQFVVSFKPRVKVDYALNKGRVYIDCETRAFTRAEYSLDLSDKEKATRAILFKKPRGLRFNPQEVEFTVTYRYRDGVSYLNYIRTKTRFKCDWKRRLFSSGYTAIAEMVMIDRDDNPAEAIARKAAFRQKDIFSDMVDNFNDSDFWKDYNIIEPSESLEKAVVRLGK